MLLSRWTERIRGETLKRLRPSNTKTNHLEGSSSTAHEVSDQTLIEVIKGNGKLVPQVVKIWVERWFSSGQCCLRQFKACGTKYHIKGDLLEEIDVDDVVAPVVSVLSFGKIETDIGILLHIISQTRYFGQLDLSAIFGLFTLVIILVSGSNLTCRLVVPALNAEMEARAIMMLIIVSGDGNNFLRFILSECCKS
ncbi:unnamed protein product [Citrullus colocynthis]|uniref:Uncharacterized protein n=1 Tax=Citrullus colocynthis TaxID=252529 RepID=A0ABP0YBP8_9ROSI